MFEQKRRKPKIQIRLQAAVQGHGMQGEDRKKEITKK